MQSVTLSVEAQDVEVPESQLSGLARLIDDAMAQSPRVIARNAQTAITEANLVSVKSQRLPQLSASGQFLGAREKRGDFTTTTDATKIYYSVTLSQPVYHWGTIRRSIGSQHLRGRLDAEGRVETYLNLVRDVRHNYLRWIVLARIASRESLRLSISRGNLELARAQFEDGSLARAQLNQSENDLQRREIEYATAQSKVSEVRRLLSRLTGVPEQDFPQVEDTIPLADLESQALIATSLLTSFVANELPDSRDIRQAVLEMEIRANDLSDSRMTLRPDLDFVTGVTQNEQSYSANVGSRFQYESLYAGLRLNWRIFDGFRSRGAIQAAVNRLKQAETQVATVKLALLDSAEAVGEQLKILSMTIALQERELASAEYRFNYTRDRVEDGDLAQSDLDVARVNLENQTISALSARLDYWNKITELLALVEADPAIGLVPLHQS